MLQHIDKLRQKPEHIRRHIAFFTSLCFTGLIFAIWIGVFKLNTEVVANARENIKTPASALSANVSDSLKYIKEMIVGSNKTEYKAVIEATAGKR